MTKSGQQLTFPVSQPYQGPIYFATVTGQALSGAAMAYIQQMVNTVNSQYNFNIIFVANLSTSTGTTVATTTRQQLTQNQVYVTTSSGLPIQISLLVALQQALDDYNAKNPQQPAVVMIYSNGQKLPTTFTTPISGPIYFAFIDGRPPTSPVLEALQIMINTINTRIDNNWTGATSSTISKTTITVT